MILHPFSDALPHVLIILDIQAVHPTSPLILFPLVSRSVVVVGTGTGVAIF